MSELERLRAEVKLLKAEKKRAEMEASFLKKTRRNREEAGLSRLRYTQIYLAIKEEHEEQGYPITELCKLGLDYPVSILGIIFGNKCFYAGRIKDGHIRFCRVDRLTIGSVTSTRLSKNKLEVI